MESLNTAFTKECDTGIKDGYGGAMLLLRQRLKDTIEDVSVLRHRTEDSDATGFKVPLRHQCTATHQEAVLFLKYSL